MSTRGRIGTDRSRHQDKSSFRMAPMARAIAVLVAAGGVIGHAQAQQAFSGAWFAGKGAIQSTAAATGRMPDGSAASLLTSPQAQQQKANAELQLSLNNLNLAARAIAAQQAAQAAARQAALAAGSSVPDGLGEGGLKVDTDSLTAGWANAARPVQTSANGKTTVAIQQTADKAILNWETFNVGKNTTVQFQQQKDWAVLNRVNDPQARPSQVQGQIKADGTVMLVNRNGIVFSGSAQVDTRNLVAAAARITDDQFKARGLYGDSTGSAPTFTDAAGTVRVEAGARIATAVPQSVTQGGGYVLLLGKEVRNAGQITTPGGQAALAAGDSFTIRKGVGTDANTGSTTAGNEVAPARNPGSDAGTVVNTGLITATTGDITLTGHSVTQAGVVLATTSTGKRGTVHLSTRASDDSGSVTLAPDSVTAILLDTGSATALDSQRDAALQRMGAATTLGNAVGGLFDNLSSVVDRRDLSRVEIVSGDTVEFQGGSLTLATGGEIAVSATRRALIGSGALLDVSGAVGVKVAMESNTVAINVQGNEQRDAPGNRDGKALNNLDLYVDRRRLVRVAAGTNGYATERWYTEGGLLEVSGYLATGGHTVGQWMAQGGTVTVTGGDLVTRAGSGINLSGGTLDVATGTIRQSWLKGGDGRLYEATAAPGDLLYTGLYRGFEDKHARWGDSATGYYLNPLIAPQSRLENGYTVGRDAGKLVVATADAVLEGGITGTTFQGPRQTQAAQAGLDGYRQSQNAVARGGELVVGQYRPVFSASTGGLLYAMTPLLDRVTLGVSAAGIADTVGLGDTVAAERAGSLRLDTASLGASGLGAVRIATKSDIGVSAVLRVADGGEIVLYAPAIDVAADLVAHAGTIRLGNVLNQPSSTSGNPLIDVGIALPGSGVGGTGGVTLRAGATLDATGRFSDLRTAAGDPGAMAFVNGGTVSIRSTESVTLEAGSLIDVSSGAAILAKGSVSGGTGGNVQLGSGLVSAGGGNPLAVLTIDGELRGDGVKGGGTLQIESASGIVIGDSALGVDKVLKAGTSLPLGVALLQDYRVEGGEILPTAIQYRSTLVLAGAVVPAEGGGPAARDETTGETIWYTLQADWTPPKISVQGLTVLIQTADGRSIFYNFYNQASLPPIAKGTAVRLDPSMPKGWVVPKEVFPDGIILRSEALITLPAGNPAPADGLVIGAGTLLKAGAVLSRDAAVTQVTSLGSDRFQSGFARYDVRAHNGMVVADGTTLDVNMPVLPSDPAAWAAAAASGQRPAAFLPAPYLEQPSQGVATRRGGADLSLAVGTGNVSATGSLAEAVLIVGEGTRLRVDPGRSITLVGDAGVSVGGLLQARGGSIRVLGQQATIPGKTLEDGGGLGDGTGKTNTLLLGEHAVLDASAESFVATDALGRPYGVLTDGGSIVVGGTLREAVSGSRAPASDAFVVVRPGALLDAAGGFARLDPDGAGTRTVASNGGSISLASSSGLYLDGTLRAQAGGAGAAGGSLVVALEAPRYSADGVSDTVQALRELTLVQQRAAGASDASGLRYGHGLLGVDQVTAGGFSTLGLYSNGVLGFGSDVHLHLGKELRLYSGGLVVADGVDPSIAVALSAPYVLLAGLTDVTAEESYVRPSYSGGVSTLASTAVLDVQGRLIDIKGAVNLGLNVVSNAMTVERAGFGQLNLASEGDLRFVKGTKLQSAGFADAGLSSSGDILLRAAQVYPDSGVTARVLAGRADAQSLNPAGRLVVERYDPAAADPASPLSVSGSLSLAAGHIEQGGVLRAPLGNIGLGVVREFNTGSTLTVTLASGSLTSVSGAGLVMPYGGTSDGVNYDSQIEGRALGESGVAIAAGNIAVEAGARLDLSGGGTLLGAGFVSGRGGSTDARLYPLMQVGSGGFTLPSLATNAVYAIVPGYASAYAPTNHGGAADPGIGRQVAIGANQVPGLPAGTYTLLPSNYALMPGAFRVEINGTATAMATGQSVAMRNGSYAVAGTLGTANTGLANALPSALVVTPADVLRTYSQYNETSVADFALQQAALTGVALAVRQADAKKLALSFLSSSDSSLRFDGKADFTPAPGGRTGSLEIGAVSVDGSQPTRIEVLGSGAGRTPGFEGVSLYASDLNGIGAARMNIGGVLLGNQKLQSNLIDITSTLSSIVLRQGATLRAAEVFLVTGDSAGSIVIEAGAGINTIGMGKAPLDSSEGYVYRPGRVSVVAASNGWLNMLAPQADDRSSGSGTISIGVCDTVCTGASGTTELYSEGTLLAATRHDFQLGDNVRYGTRNLVLGVGAVNAGSAESLAAAAARGALTPGLTLDQTVLDRLLRGDTTHGAPALERLVLTAAESVNFFGTVALDTRDPVTGKSRLADLVLSTPALYGQGAAGDVATISTGKLTWAGLANDAPAPVLGGRGTGAGQLRIDADVIEFGYDSSAQPSGLDDNGRTILGFADVGLNARQRITANQKGSLGVYRSQATGETGPVYTGGNLVLTAPLMTGAGGSVNRITAGGSLQLLAPSGGGADAAATTLAAGVQTGAELQLKGGTVRIDTTVALPSGKLTVAADGDIALGDAAWLDLAGRDIVFFDTHRYSWGGDLSLRSSAGNITQAARSTIDLSAANNNAGLLSAVALAEGAGRIDLQGTLKGSASGRYDAGGTLVPYRAGGADLRAQTLGTGSLTADFAALNTRLNSGGFVGERSFQLKQGDLVIGNELKGRKIDLSLDAGRLDVAGTIDASGEQVGSIRLAAANGLSLGGAAMLDAHGTVLRIDSYGQIIDSPNRAIVQLDSGTGTLRLAEGARLDLRHGTYSAGDGRARGTLDLFAPRIGSNGLATDGDAATYGDIAIDARGAVNIQGARSIAVYGRQRYTDAPYGADAAASGRPYQVIDQAYLNVRHGEAESFIGGALANGELLQGKLAGLNNGAYRDVFHLRPAIEIASATPDGDLVVQGDLDLSGLRYASLNPNTPLTGVYGSGEVGMLTLRAGGDLSVYGSINDGFAPPPATPDDGGWILVPGVQPFGGDVVVPVAGVTLAEGTTYPAGKTLNYAITARDVTLPAGTVLPRAVTLDTELALTAGTVLAADLRNADGSVLLAAGTVVGAGGLTAPAGTQLLAGTRLPVALTLASLNWPQGVKLPVAMVQSGSLALAVGAVIVSGTSVTLPGDALSVDLRPADSSGRQAQNWAVAQMLPEGSQSWSLRLVAGADLGAAGTATRNTLHTGNIVLADAHYTLQKSGGESVIGLNPQGVDAIVNAGGGLPSGIDSKSQLVGKTEAEIIALYMATSWEDFGLPADFWSPSSGNILLGLTAQGVTAIVNAGGGLPAGINTSAELIGKTETQIVTLYQAFSFADFGLPADFWDITVGNGAVFKQPLTLTPRSPVFSVLRTGTGDLDIAAGGSFSMLSPYGVYTAGTSRSLGDAALDAGFNQARGRANGGTVLGSVAGSTAAAYESLVSGPDSLYRAWYPAGGGNLRVDVGGDLTGDSWSASRELANASASVGNWIWRQGTGGAAGVDPVPTAWWTNFGTYFYNAASAADGSPQYWPSVVGFTGIGTLGGGNADIRVGGDAGVLAARSLDAVGIDRSSRSQGVVLAVGSTGRVLADGSVVLTGGGDLDVRIDGGWNNHVEARAKTAANSIAQALELNGGLVNLRGSTRLDAGQVGTTSQVFGAVQDPREVRVVNPFESSISTATGGLMLMQGDNGASITSRGDLVLGGTGNAGLVATPNSTGFVSNAGNGETGQTWFSLWTDRTAVQLFSAGGNLAFDSRASATVTNTAMPFTDYGRNGGWYLLPGHVSAVAGIGSIYFGLSAAYGLGFDNDSAGLLLAPLGDRNVELLAGRSLYGGGTAVAVSGTDTSAMATVQRPGFAGFDSGGTILVGNASADSPLVDIGRYPLLPFASGNVGSAAGVAAVASQASHFYAAGGDIVGLQTGAKLALNGVRTSQVDYMGFGPVAVRAGRDIVNTGTSTQDAGRLVSDTTNDGSSAGISGNLIVHTHANDVSVVSAGRDIVYANFDIAGPGTLEISAGRNIVQNDRGSLNSIGPVVRGDARPGAAIAVQAGVGAQGGDYAGFLSRYLDPSRQAVTGTALADQPGKVVRSYGAELAAWLAERYGFQGTAAEAQAYFAALAPEQQRIFARQVYFAELREGGREYNDAAGPRFGSYLRGRDAIAALFPSSLTYGGDLLMYGGSGIHTDLGGAVQVLTPGGAQTYGVEGAAPPSTAGLITRGQGDIQLYSQGSILLGQSRVMTTFGGAILAWSAQGDINAGRGSKTTVVYTPPLRVYDAAGNVRLTPDVPSTGAGIATLNPLPEVVPGDIDLIAPLGTIDAGEAGIRVSGNVNIAALQVVNAANIQVQGKSAGIPVIAAVDVGALNNASAAASQAVNAAQDVVQRERVAARQALPSIVTVRVLGTGNEAPQGVEPAPAAPARGGQQSSLGGFPYDPQSFVQVAGHGDRFDPAVMARLTEAEQRELRKAR